MNTPGLWPRSFGARLRCSISSFASGRWHSHRSYHPHRSVLLLTSFTDSKHTGQIRGLPSSTQGCSLIPASYRRILPVPLHLRASLACPRGVAAGAELAVAPLALVTAFDVEKRPAVLARLGPVEQERRAACRAGRGLACRGFLRGKVLGLPVQHLPVPVLVRLRVLRVGVLGRPLEVPPRVVRYVSHCPPP